MLQENRSLKEDEGNWFGFVVVVVSTDESKRSQIFEKARITHFLAVSQAVGQWVAGILPLTLTVKKLRLAAGRWRY
jgi:hypothetical protein